jgi:hypothetical protein
MWREGLWHQGGEQVHGCVTPLVASGDSERLQQQQHIVGRAAKLMNGRTINNSTYALSQANQRQLLLEATVGGPADAGQRQEQQQVSSTYALAHESAAEFNARTPSRVAQAKSLFLLH